MASPKFRTGAYSKVLPARMRQTYEEAQANPAFLSVRKDIAACEARLIDLFQRVDTGESGHLWQALRRAIDLLTAAMADKDIPAMNRHLTQVRDLITTGSNDYAAWTEIQALWETRCKLTLTEQKTLLGTHQMITAEQLMIYFGVITDAINRIVPAHADTDTTRAILGALSAEFHNISLREHRGGA